MGSTVAAGALVLLALLGLGPRTGAYRVATVLSGSMGSTAPPGAVAVSTPMPASEVKAGDVISYRIPIDDHRLVTHRVVEVVEAGPSPIVRTKGDATNTVDPWLAQLEPGTVWRFRLAVPYLGFALAFLQSSRAQTVLLGLVPFLLAWIFLRQIWRNSPAGQEEDEEPQPHRPRIRWRPGWVRAAGTGTLVMAMVLSGGRALGSFTSEGEAALPLSSATLAPASNLNGTGGCDLLILGAHVNLSWTATPSTWATGYRLERWRNGALEQTYTLPGAATNSYTADDVAGSRTYTFKLSAYKQAWTSTTIEKTVSTPFCLL